MVCCSDVQPWLIFSNRYYIRSVSVDGRYYDILTQTLHNVVALDYDLSQRQLYFIDARQKKLLRMSMNGTGMEAVVSQGLHSPEGLAVDWIGRQTIYIYVPSPYVTYQPPRRCGVVVTALVVSTKLLYVDPG